MKLVIPIVLAFVAGCFEAHPAGATDVTQNDCVTCHMTEFQTSATHMGQGSTACARCHAPGQLPAWAFAHPQSPFPTESGNHSRFASQCHTCHDSTASSDYIANLDCFGGGACHQDRLDHEGAGKAPGRCFHCHPTGTADGGD